MTSEAKRRAGATQAIDTGKPTITEPISLLQADKATPGVLLYLPVYAPGTTINSVAERRASLLGMVYAPIVIKELLDNMPDVQTGQLDFELFDSQNGKSLDRLIFDADQHATRLPSGAPDDKRGRLFHTLRPVSLPGRTMHL